MSAGTATVAPSKSPPVQQLSQEERDPLVLPPIVNANNGPSPESSKNPFAMPPDRELFTLREKERKLQKEERSKDRLLRVHEKGTYRSRMNEKLSSLRKLLADRSTSGLKEDTEEEGTEKASRIHKQTQFVLATTRDRHIEKEDLTNYIGKKREMFLLQYSLGVKRDEIQKLEEIARTEETKLESAEKYLEQSATMFDEFLKENDKNSVEAIKMAEAATKAKLEKVGEIKRLNAQIVALKSEISRNEDILNELKTFRRFLTELAPEEWHAEREKKKNLPKVIATDDDEDTYDKEELYFTSPAQLMAIFSELEEQNLSLIQNSQATQETLEGMRQSKQYNEEKMENELKVLKKQVDALMKKIEKAEQKGYDLETKSKLYSFGEFKAEDQESMLHALDKKVAEVYNKCIGGHEATVNTLQMLAAIEGRMEELFEELENLPAEKVESAEKAKDKERRLRLREQKLEEQRQHQEERLKRALERSQADPKKRNGRKLIYRSEPPVMKRKTKESDDMKEREEEELQYFFS